MLKARSWEPTRGRFLSDRPRRESRTSVLPNLLSQFVILFGVTKRRMDWGLTDVPVVQVNVTVTFPGRIRAWGIHRFTVDRLFAAAGSLCIVCYEGRRSSPNETPPSGDHGDGKPDA
jgi:hypothetical protein